MTRRAFGRPRMPSHLLDLAHRAIEVGALEEKSAPIDFMKWARSIGIEFHPDWWDAVGRKEALVKEETEAPPPADLVVELKTREQETLLKMVAAMAMGFYGWDRNALRSNATAEIASDLAKARRFA